MSRRAALVTGGGTGLGLATARGFRAAGYRVLVFTPPWDPVPEADRVEGLHEISVDLAEPEQIARAFREAGDIAAPLDVLVNNAAVFERRAFADLDLETWERTLRINLTAPFLCCQHFCRLATPGRAYIFNILSDAYYVGPRKGAHYAASKGGLVGLTRSMARILGERGIRVVGIAPGITETRQSQAKGDRFEEIARTIPLGRIARPGDVSAVVVALASGDFDYVTGEILHLNGGRHMR
jgi:NAD(P)-dependent dehydrogenase (short-subunit alcohol dehydrogenase family)